MNTGPMKLNIPPERKNYLAHWIIAGCVLFTVAAAFFSIDFAIAFFASSIISLPMLLLNRLPRQTSVLIFRLWRAWSFCCSHVNFWLHCRCEIRSRSMAA